jgi:hypothetical protein
MLGPHRLCALALVVVAASAAEVASAQPHEGRGAILVVGSIPPELEAQLRAELATLALELVPAEREEASPGALERSGAVAALDVGAEAIELRFAQQGGPTRAPERAAIGQDARAARRAAIWAAEILRARIALRPTPPAPVQPPPASLAMSGAPTLAFVPDPTFRSRAAAPPPRSAVPPSPAPAALAPPAPARVAAAPTPPAPRATVTARAAPPPPSTGARRASRLALDGGLAVATSPGGFGPAPEAALFARWLSRFGVGVALRARLPLAPARAEASAGSVSSRVTFVGASLEAARTSPAASWSYGGGAGVGYGRAELTGTASRTGLAARSGALQGAWPFAAARVTRRLSGSWHAGVEALVALASPTAAAGIEGVEVARWGAPWLDAAFVVGGAW